MDGSTETLLTSVPLPPRVTRSMTRRQAERVTSSDVIRRTEAHNVLEFRREIQRSDEDIEEVFSTDSSASVDEETLGSEIDLDECACCHRVETDNYALELTEISVVTRRLYGDKNLPNVALLCTECAAYLGKRVPHPQWVDAWPAVIFTFLTSETLDCDSRKLVEILPRTIKDSFRLLVPRLSPNISAVWQCPSKSVDATQQLKEFKTDLLKHAGLLANKLNNTCFPSVKCPMGCNTYLDGEVDKEVDYLPLVHYLGFICPQFTSFEANSNFFRGARPDWPSRGEYEGFEYAASLIVDAQKGLVVVTCSKTIHADGKSLYIHVPRNPVLGTTSELRPDLIAPVSANPHFVRAGRSNEYCSSHTVYSEHGDSSGASSFSLTPRPYVTGPCNVPQIKSMGLTLNQREDIFHSLVEAKTLPTELFHHMKESYERRPLNNETVDESKASGTYVDFVDASHMLMSYNQRLSTGPNDERHHELRIKGKDVLQLVHPGNKVGRLPFKMPHLSKPNGLNHNGLVLHSVLTALLHNRHLHHLFLTKLETENRDSINHQVQSSVLKIVSGLKLNKPLELEEQLIHMAVEKAMCDVDSQTSRVSSAILSAICDVQAVSIHRNLSALERLAERSEKVLLVDCLAVNASKAPVSLCEGRWQLMMAYKYSYDHRNRYKFEMDFRWTSELKWHHCLSETALPSTVGDNPRPLLWNTLLYIETDSVECLSKTEFLNWSGGQTKLKCSQHRSQFLIKERPGSILRCCTAGCQSSVRFRCGKGFGRRAMSCRAGLCLKHANLVLKSDAATTYIQPSLENVPLLPLTANENDEEVEDAAAGIHILDDNPPLVPEEVDNVAEMYATPLDNLARQLPVATEYVEPSYSTNANSTSGHFLLNKCLNMMSRVDINRKSPVSFQNLLTHIHSISPENSLPLLYPEGLLFPTIFWAAVDRSIIGALPSVFYSQFGRRSIYGGFASLVDHLRVRLFDSSLLTSHDPNYLGFAFDVYLNSLLQGNSVSVALRKGLEHVNRAYVVPESRESSLKFDEADSRREVKRLSAMMADNPWDYFLTLTCNDSETMGVAPIRKALEKRYRGQELDKQLQNACPLLCRAWARSVHYFFEFLMHGEEKIFGELKNVWFRFEFQNSGSPGNKPHVHAGLTLKDRSRNDTERLKKVHNNLIAMFNEDNRTDEKSLIKDGLVKDHDDFVKLYKLADLLTQHNCANSRFKCMKITSKDGNKRCRVPKYLSTVHPKYTEHTHMYDLETRERLLRLGLGKRRYPPELDHLTELHNDVVVEPTLVGGRYNYAGEKGVRRVPSNGRIFAMMRSMVNLQICDIKFTSSYLAKYAAGADEKREVVITTTGKDATKVDVEPRDLYHSKISGSRIAHTEKLRAENAKEAFCREITATEMVWFTHQLPFVVCTADFVHCSTHAPEHRQVVYRQRGGYIQKLINEDGSLKGTTLRADFPIWRQFTRSQTMLMSEIVNSPYLVDNTSLFSVRPPELLQIARLEDYLKWFSFSSAKVITVSDEVSECPWIDGSGKRVRVRKRYLAEVRRFFQSLANRVLISPGTLEIYGLLETLDHEVVQGRDSAFVNRFVDMSADRDVVVVFTCIEPTSMSKFLVHLLLTLGTFTTELDLFRGPSLLHAFQYARLIADAASPTEKEALAIIRLYVMTQLRSLPYGAKAFSRQLALAMDGLLYFFRTRGVEYIEVPLASLRAIRADATLKLSEMETLRALTLASVLETSGIKNCPTAAVLGSMRKFDFAPVIERLPEQSRSSHAEQLLCLHALVDAVDSFERVGHVFVPCPLIVGPPGAGKTHLLLTACVYALSKGLRTIITAATAERARSLGGEHIHLLFAMPTVKQVTESVPVTAEKCLLNLCASPVKMAYLKRLDVLVVEEVGLLSASLLNIMDFVLRRLRDSAVPFGGVLLLCCGDPCQLKPVRGRSIWLMPNLITMFSVLGLKHFVRSRGDPELQTLIKCIRKTKLDAQDMEESIAIITNRCSPHQFVKSWEEVPDEYQRVVGKIKAVEYAVDIYLKQKKSTPGLQYIIQHAYDEVEVSAGYWISANAAVSRELTRECKEPSELLLYCRQVLRLTYNNSTPTARVPKFSQGQLAVILQLPDLNLPRHAQRITIKLVPPGVRVVSVNALPDEWPSFAIARRFTIPQMIHVHMAKAKREQWPFTYFVCTTVHKSIGETLPKLATQISQDNSMFSLWDKNQLLVILSRVQSLDDLLFVGDVGDTVRAMKKLLEVTDPWDQYIHNIVNACDNIRQGDGILPRTGSYPSILSCVPSTESGFVFMLVSMKFDSFIVDSGPSLRRALKTYNDPINSAERRSKRPWVLAVFTACFADNTAMVDFKMLWQARILQHHGFHATCYQALETGRVVFHEEKLTQPSIKMQECITLRGELNADI